MTVTMPSNGPFVKEDLARLEDKVVRCLAMSHREHLPLPQPQPSPLKWTIPSLVSDKGLASVAVETLRVCLQPVLDGLQALDSEALLELQRCRPDEQGGAVLRDNIRIHGIHREIEPPSDPTSVRYIHLSEVDGQYSMGIFVFPPYARIPLHDHPGMCVLSRVLYGDLQRLSLDLDRNFTDADRVDYNHRHSSWFKKSRPLPPGSKLAHRRRVDHLTAPECVMLYPYEGNLHEFVAGAHGAAVLDVLLPPYDVDHHRDCTFYEIRDADDAKTSWIVPTGQPEDFHCISGRYRGVGATH